MNNVNIKSTGKISVRYVFLVCMAAALGGFLFGFDTAVISGALPLVVNDFKLTTGMEGWFVSSALLGCIIGVGVAGLLSDRFGRKKVLLISALLFVTSSVGCMLADNLSILIIYRILGGLGIGVASMICPLYISEFSPPRLRGRMVALYQLAITIGIVGAYFSNALLLEVSESGTFTGLLKQLLITDAWRGMIGIGVIPAFIFLLLLLFVPESPRWLLVNGREGKAILYLNKIYGPEQAATELREIKTATTGSKNFKVLFSSRYRVALIIGLALPFLSQTSGINAIIYYGPSILDKAGFSLSGAFGGQVTIGIVNVICTFIAIFTVDKWGRRPLLIVGITGAILSLVVTGLLFSMGVTNGPWILISILLFIACFAFSFGPVC